MSADHFDGVEQFEADLWKIADDLHVWQQAASGMFSEAA